MNTSKETKMSERPYEDLADEEWQAAASEEPSSEWGDYYDALYDEPEWI